MKSPITGKEMILQSELRDMQYRGKTKRILFEYYLCEESGERFTDVGLDERNLRRLKSNVEADAKKE